MFVVGENSGDLHASSVAAELQTLRPDVKLVGVGGDRMAAQGVELLEHSRSLAVMGFVEVVRHVPLHYALLARIRRRLKTGKVGLVIVVDYPGFNMKVARAARLLGIPVLYYITPQVWAWGAKRLPELSRVITKAAPILPFEEKLLRANGIDATFVGHPLLDRALELPTRSAARLQLGVPDGVPLLALFPGSRVQEINMHFDSFIAAASELQRRVPALRVVVSAAGNVRIDPAKCPFPVVTGASFVVLRAADAALCKSGTTTLESAVAGCPMVVAYRTSRWTYALARRVVKIPRIGLVNVVADREVAREFLQDAVNPVDIASALEPLLRSNSPERLRALADLEFVRSQLGEPGAAERVARMAVKLLAER